MEDQEVRLRSARASTAIAMPRDSDLPVPPPQLVATAPTRVFVSEKQHLQFGLMSHDSFGAYSPQWTIPSSRHPPKPPPDFPGPGHYQVPAHPPDLRYPHVIVQKPVYDDATITSNVDMTTPRRFPGDDTRRIAEWDGIHYYMPIPISPPPSYNPPVFDPRRRTTIGPKRKDDPPGPSPGPAKYTPVAVLPRSAAFGIPKVQKREVWEDPPDTPGPGEYETIPQLRKPKRWAGKLRVRTERMKKKDATRDRPWSAVSSVSTQSHSG
jgi:hypothetical protein